MRTIQGKKAILHSLHHHPIQLFPHTDHIITRKLRRHTESHTHPAMLIGTLMPLFALLARAALGLVLDSIGPLVPFMA